MNGIKTPSVPAVEKALSALELLAQSRTGLTLGEVTRRMGLPKSSVHCLLLTLERRGYLHRNAKSRYLFGLKLFGLANMALSGIGLREKALPFLKALMARTRLTVHLAMLEQGEAVLIEKVEPPNVYRLATWLGKRMDVHCTGVGKALIAHLPEEEVERLVRERGLPRHNDNTICSLRRLREEIARTRRLGYALDDEEDELGARCIGAPIFDGQNQAVAAVSVSGTTVQVTSENLAAISEQVKECAASITAVLA